MAAVGTGNEKWFLIVPASPGNVIDLSEARRVVEHPRDAMKLQR